LEWFLSWSALHTICFSIAAKNILGAIGLGFGTWLAVILVYIGLSVKIDQIHAARAKPIPTPKP
jgi:hypothetical protein